MILEIDAGNTRLKWRLIGLREVIVERGVVDNNREFTAFFLNDKIFASVRGVLVSCVAGGAGLEVLCEAFKSRLGKERVFEAVSKAESGGIRFAYDDPARLGVDRVMAMVAGLKRCPEGVMVVDCGSAITVDLVSCSGEHLGGYILPGLRLLSASLLQGTSEIFIRETVQGSRELGKSTESCVSNGSYAMLLASLEWFEVLAKGFGIDRYLLTGGDSVQIKEMGLLSYECVEDLVFEGLEAVSPFAI